MKFHFKFKTYLPLIVILVVIVDLTFLFGWLRGNYSTQSLMLDFMAWWFIVFASFKLANLKNFAEAYSLYDILAMKIPGYGLAYPFIELALGLMFLFRFGVIIVAFVTLVLMSINAVGAFKGARDKKVLMCACMGAVFKLPMSWISLGEDLLMVVMAAGLILMNYL